MTITVPSAVVRRMAKIRNAAAKRAEMDCRQITRATGARISCIRQQDAAESGARINDAKT